MYVSLTRLTSCVAGCNAVCIANKCSCVNGVESTGAKCVRDGIESCESCNAGFRLSSANKTCAGMFIVIVNVACKKCACGLCFVFG